MRPPTREKARHAKNAAGLEKGSLESGTGAKPSGGRPENQGNRPHRNPAQPAPRWPRAPQADALDGLEREATT